MKGSAYVLQSFHEDYNAAHAAPNYLHGASARPVPFPRKFATVEIAPSCVKCAGRVYPRLEYVRMSYRYMDGKRRLLGEYRCGDTVAINFTFMAEQSLQLKRVSFLTRKMRSIYTRGKESWVSEQRPLVRTFQV